MAGFSDMLGGLFGSGASDQGAVDPNTGLSEAQRYQTYSSGLAQLGGLLMAAGQKQMPADRAKYLSQLGSVPAAMNQQTTQMMQQKLMGLNMQKTQTELEREKRIGEDIKNNIDKIPESQRAFAIANPVDYARIQAGASLSQQFRNPTDFEQKYKAAVQGGADPQTAAQFASGALHVVKNAAGENVLMNALTGQITKPQGGGVNLPGAPTAENPQGGQTPSAPQNTAPAASPQFPNASIPANLPYSNIFGPSGAINSVAAKIQDVSGVGMTQGTGAAYAANSNYDIARNEVKNALGADVPGRNLKGTQAAIEKLLPESSSFFTNRGQAAERLTAAQNMLTAEAQHLASVAHPDSSYDFKTKEKANNALQQLLRARDNLGVINSSITGAQGGAPQGGPQQTPASTGGYKVLNVR